MTENDYITEAEALSDIYEEYSEPINRELYFAELWEELKSEGFVWRDRYGQNYKAKTLAKDKRRLRNIINYAKRNDRPLKQIEVLEGLL